MTISSDKEVEKFRKVSAKNRKQGDDYENRMKRRLRLKKQRGSGCGVIEKEDLVGQDPRGEPVMVQAKSFSGKTITIKVEDLERLVRHAKDCTMISQSGTGVDLKYKVTGRRPVFVIGIVDQIFAGPKDWVLIPLEEWEKYE